MREATCKYKVSFSNIYMHAGIPIYLFIYTICYTVFVYAIRFENSHHLCEFIFIVVLEELTILPPLEDKNT